MVMPEQGSILDVLRGENGRLERAVKYFIIAANLGHDEALETVKKAYQYGDASKEDFEAALRGHQAALDATKSQQRDEAYAFDNLKDMKKAIDYCI